MKKKLVVLTGAGMSAESGISTFRDSDGLWEHYRVEDVATPEGFRANPGLVLDFYNQRRKEVLATKPNEGHYGLAELEKDFDVRIVTQNIDNLHERAGSHQVIHLHGEIMKACTMRDQQTTYDLPPENPVINLGDKDPHGEQLRPFIVWFGEARCRVAQLRAPRPADLPDRPERGADLARRHRAHPVWRVRGRAAPHGEASGPPLKTVVPTVPVIRSGGDDKHSPSIFILRQKVISLTFRIFPTCAGLGGWLSAAPSRQRRSPASRISSNYTTFPSCSSACTRIRCKRGRWPRAGRG